VVDPKQIIEAIKDIDERIEVVAQDFESETGIELEFQAEIGCAGECFGCYGPYQIRDGESAYGDDVITGESW
tara:strand:+ start:353 stop:568 length:216 start_codon:yes stop_codon:yes gene_type:complete